MLELSDKRSRLVSKKLSLTSSTTVLEPHPTPETPNEAQLTVVEQWV